jgi:hypothetical protein
MKLRDSIKRTLEMMSSIYPHAKIDKTLVLTWHYALTDLSDEAIQGGLELVLREHTTGFLPTPQLFRKFCLTLPPKQQVQLPDVEEGEHAIFAFERRRREEAELQPIDPPEGRVVEEVKKRMSPEAKERFAGLVSKLKHEVRRKEKPRQLSTSEETDLLLWKDKLQSRTQAMREKLDNANVA